MSGPAEQDAPSPQEVSPRPGPLLALLNRFAVDYAVVGAAAVRARGAEPDPTADPALVVTPDPVATNLARLAEALTHAGTPRLRAGAEDGPRVRLGASLFPHIPTLCLRTDLGDVTVALSPPGAPPSFPDLMSECTREVVDGVTVRVPTVRALLRGLAGGGAPPTETLLGSLRSAASRSEAGAAAAPPPDDAVEDLGRLMLAALVALPQPCTVRELLAVVSRSRPVTYRQVRAEADRLAVCGQLRRIRAGTANRYELVEDRDERTARLVADLLRLSDEPERVVAGALDLLRRERGPRDYPGRTTAVER